MAVWRGLLAAALSALLVACPQPGTPEVQPPTTQPPATQPPAVQPPQGAAMLVSGSLAIGAELSAPLRQSFGGSWTVQSLPDWLTADPLQGGGDLNTTLTLRRSSAVQTAAAQPNLSGTISVLWRSADGTQTGVAAFAVSAELYRVQGQLLSGGMQLAASDVSGEAARVRGTASVPAARGVIVTYRSVAARQRAMTREPGVRSAAGQSLTLQTADPQATIRRLLTDPAVASAAPDALLHALDLPSRNLSGQALAAPLLPTDDFAAAQWAYRSLGYPAVWRDMQGHPYTRPVTVAVLDTGVRYDHPDLAGKLYGPAEGALDLLSSPGNGDGDPVDRDPTDPATPGRTDISHGTHVTGIIVANWGSFTPPCGGCSGSGVVGASYTAPIKVLPIRVLDAPDGNGTESDIAAALLYAAGDPVVLGGQTYLNPHPAQVINLSLGGPLSDPAQIALLCGAVQRATQLGALVVAAAGNGGGTAPVYPAACPGAVSVASVSPSDSAVPQHAYYSDAYAQVALSAPGGNPNTSYNGGSLNGRPLPDLILSTGWNYPANLPSYALEAGTSQAAPQVSALAALLLSKGTAATPAAALDRMLQTASDLGAAGRDPLFGAGLINPAAALGAAAVSDALGVSVQDASGRSYAPALDSLGRFDAWLPDGPLRLVAGQDSNGNGFAGESGEPRSERALTLGPAQPGLNLGTLTLAP